MSAVAAGRPLETLSARLRELHAHALGAASTGSAESTGLALLERLLNDPQWRWLRPLSALIADIDHATAQSEPTDSSLEAAAAAQVRGLLFGEGELSQPLFLERYRPLLQQHAALASTHGELRGLLRAFPAEAPGEPERQSARRRWAQRCRQRRPAA